MPISGLTVKAKAENFAKELGLNSFKASDGWLGKFKQSHNINYDKTLKFRREECVVGKPSKERIRVLVVANMDGIEKKLKFIAESSLF
ncbi:hypothetical protein WA026_020161 [Henosepilachna vigintioctopunctata]|uniref:HTH CENPB-type domain-containing protein n=1 Tax=Henosepilachna vigintioctopunctata TaxID=420089 RepID=A0AAW1U4Q2_9CUCU